MRYLTRILTSPRLRRLVLIPFGIFLGILVVMLVTIPPVWEYTNSVDFCGTTCHTMPPNFITYQESPHARVTCVDCHIGRDLMIVQASRKIGHSRLVVATVLDEIEYPIEVKEMQPARQTCERCHFPEKFSDDSLRILNRVENNEENELYQIYLLMNTGGGSARDGIARGIHWHIENPVEFISTDKRQQNIPWVRMQTEEGEVVYNDINSPINTENLDEYEIHEMDCTTCHNRIAHEISSPSDIVDNAIYRGDISRDIPFIRVRAVELLSDKHFITQEEAVNSFETLHGYYEENYPDFYNGNEELVDQAVTVLEDLWTKLYYPQQGLSWDTHPDNTGHKDSPGCFRCHDGEHFSPEGEAIRLECNICHSIPTVVRSGDIEPKISLATGLEPASHLDSSWITRHREVFDASCASCHDVSNPGGSDDSSFCSNSACHGSGWEYAGFNAPGISSILRIYQTEPEPLLMDFEGDPTYTDLQPLFEQQCGACHGVNGQKNLNVLTYEGILEGGDSGVAIIPEAPENSMILDVLADGHFADLNDHQLGLITQWIANGAPE